MPVYNGEPYLRTAIESILGQSFSDFEFIIVDDGSNDQSPNIVKDFQSADCRVRLIQKEKKGIASALNQAIKVARAPILARLDCDDVALSHRLKTQFDWLTRKSELSVIGSWAFLTDADGKRNWRIKKQPVGSEKLRKLLPLHNCLLHPAVMFHKRAVEAAGMYDERFLWSQDYELWLRMLPNVSLDNIPEPLLELRRHSGQVSEPSKRRNSTLYSVAAAVNYFCHKYGEPGLSSISAMTGAEFVRKFEVLLNKRLTPLDSTALIRHLIRLRRYSFSEAPIADQLIKIIDANLSSYTRAKIKLYDMLGEARDAFR